MKTVINSYPKLEELQFDPADLKVIIDQAEIDKYFQEEMRFLSKKHGTTQDAPEGHAIEVGDILMIKVQSALPKFNKPMIPVSVGKKLYDERVERALIGMKVGETKDITLDGEKVSIEVLKAKTKTEPEITWEMVKDDIQVDYPDAGSIEEFKQMLSEEIIEMLQQDHFLDKVYEDISEQILEKMDITVDQAELDAYLEQANEHTALDAAEEGISVAEFLKYFFRGWDELSEEEIEEKYREHNVKRFLLDHYLQEVYYENNPRDQQEAYEAELKAYSEHTGEPIEEMRRQVPYEDYMLRNATGTINLEIFNRFIEKATTEVK